MSKILGKIGTFSPVTPSTGYIAYFPCGQPTTDTVLLDRSGNSRNATLGANLTAANAWATSGKLSTAYGTNDGGCVLTQAQMDSFTYGTDTLLVFFRAILTDPAANTGVFGARTKGIAIRLLTTGVVDVVINKDNGDNFITAPAGDWADGTTEHSHLFVFDTVNLKMYVYNNAIVNSAITATGTAISSGTITNNTTGWRIGGYANNATCTGRFQALHIARKTGGISSAYVASLANRLHRASHVPLSQTEWPVT
ncbi:MAG: hypothetical protein ACYC1K_03275 [Minisyncoccota bacterium]